MKGENCIFKRDGSYTVEISLLMPFIFGCILLIIFICFYLHDLCVISKDCMNIMDVDPCEKAVLDEMSEDLQQMIKDDTLGTWDFTVKFAVNIESGIERIDADVNAKMLVGGFVLPEIMSDSLFTYKTNISSYILDEQKYIRSR